MWHDYARGPACLTVSEHGGPVACAKGLRSAADVSFADCPQLDYLLVPGGFAAFDEMAARLVTFVRQRAACHSTCFPSAPARSSCTRPACWRAGATTHWKARDDMRKLPGVTVLDDRWVRDGNVWTSAGVSAGMDLLLGFIAEIDGEKAAGSVQKNAEYSPTAASMVSPRLRKFSALRSRRWEQAAEKIIRDLDILGRGTRFEFTTRASGPGSSRTLEGRGRRKRRLPHPLKPAPLRNEQRDRASHVADRRQAHALVEAVDALGIGPIHEARRVAVERENARVEIAGRDERLEARP